jgi:hypothetical protein
MTFNVTDLSAELARSGTMRTNKFMMQFPMPLSLQNVSAFQQLANTNKVMQLYCESSNLPGVATLLEEVRRYGYGPMEKRPFAPTFTNLSMNFRGDANGWIWTFLNSWMRCAIDFESRGDLNSTIGPIKNQYPYELGYKYDPQNGEGYATDTTLTMYDDTGTQQIQVVLREAYPVFVADVPVAWANRSDYVRIPVTLTFFDWYNNLVQVQNTSNIS